MTSLRHLRSSTANKRPDPAAMVDGQLAMNYDIASPGLFFKDDNGTLIKVGPVHVGTTAPNVTPAAGGTAGNSIGEQWLDTTSGVYVLKVWDGSAWRSESGTFVDVSGDTMTGALTMANQGAVRFSETTANGSNYIALQATAALDSNKTITLPDTTGTVVTTGDTGTVTSTMIANDTILNADVNASAAIAGTKISPDFGSQTVATTGIFSSAAGTAAAPSIAFTGDTNTGIYSPGADQLAVSTGGTARLTVDANGRVGIGTVSPAYGLHLSGINATSSTAQIATTATSDATVRTTTSLGTFAFGTGIGSATKCWNVYDVDNSTERLRIDSSGRLLVGTTSAPTGSESQYSKLRVTGNTVSNGTCYASFGSGAVATSLASGNVLSRVIFGSSDGDFAWIECAADATPGTNDYPGRLVFSTTADGAASPTERMRITSAGQVLIGTTLYGSAGTSFTNLGTQVLYNNNSSDTGVSLWMLSSRAADTNRQFLYFQANVAVTPTLVFQVLNNGNTQNANGSYTSISDVKLKQNIVDANSQWNDIKAIKIRNWNFKEETGLETHRQIGPVAQELELICPGLVSETFDRDDDGNNLETATKGVNQSVLYMKAVKALQEAMERIETLEAAVAALQSA